MFAGDTETYWLGEGLVKTGKIALMRGTQCGPSSFGRNLSKLSDKGCGFNGKLIVTMDSLFCYIMLITF